LLHALSLGRSWSRTTDKLINGLLDISGPGADNPDISLFQSGLGLGTNLTGDHGLGSGLNYHLGGLDACTLGKIHVLIIQPLMSA
jgi:hypothetical protein